MEGVLEMISLKDRKRFSVVSLIVLTSIILTGCNLSHTFNSESLKNSVTKVEIIDLSEYEGSLYPDDEKSYDVLITLVDDQIENFIDDFVQLEYKKYYGPPNDSPKGVCIKMFFSDETYAVISYYTFLHFKKDGKGYLSTLNIHTDETDYFELISKYADMDTNQ